MTIIVPTSLSPLDLAAASLLSRGLDAEQRRFLIPESGYDYSARWEVSGSLEIGKEPLPRRTPGDAAGTLGLLLDMIGPHNRTKAVRGLTEALVGLQTRQVECSEESRRMAKALIDLTTGVARVSAPIRGSLEVEVRHHG